MSTVTKDWTQAPVAELMDHIVEAHHEFLRREMPRIGRLIQEAGSAAPPALAARFEAFVEEMTAHLWKEERILFPMIRALDAGMAAASSHCGGVQHPLRVMLMEHDMADQSLQEFRRLTNEYRSEGTGLAVLYRALEELEADVREHMRKENDILFPRAAQMD